MNILMDTHAFLWYFQGNEQLSFKAAEILEDTDNDLCLSMASLWEIAIKLSLGKLTLQNPFHELPDVLEQLMIRILPISFADTECCSTLPFHHRDPFDRMLISQAINHSLVIVSVDTAFDAYPIQRLWT